MAPFEVVGFFKEEGGLVYAVSSDGRFVTHGATRKEALDYMGNLLGCHFEAAEEHGFDPNVPLSRRAAAQDVWRLEAAPA